MKRIAVSVLLPLAFAACSSAPTVYGPAATNSDVGYRQTKIEDDRYRVSFRANSDLKAPQVEDMALRRAAEIALENGREWFLVVNRFTDLSSGSSGGSSTSVGFGGSSGSYGSSSGMGIGFSFGPDTRRYESTLEILLGSGAKPASADAYEARAVLNLKES
jgi:hypothetical protein